VIKETYNVQSATLKLDLMEHFEMHKHLREFFLNVINLRCMET